MSRLGGERRFAVRRHAKSLLQFRGATVHEARANDRMRLERGGQSFQEASRCKGWMGAAACMMALYSSSLRLSGMGEAPGWRGTMTPPGLQLQEHPETIAYSNAKMRFQSFFMLMTVQPSLFASS